MPATLQKIVARQNQSVLDGNNRQLVFRAVFDQAIQDIDENDFAVVGATTATVTSVVPASNGNPLAYDITVAGGDLDTVAGEVGLALADNPTITSVEDGAPLNPLPEGFKGSTFTLEGGTTPEPPEPPAQPEPPIIEELVIREDLSSLEEGNRRLVFRATFNEDVQNVDANDFIVTGGTSATITDVLSVNQGDGRVFDIVVENGDLNTFVGEVGLDLVDSPTIASVDDNTPLAVPGETIGSQTFTLVASIPTEENPEETPGSTPPPPVNGDGLLSAVTEVNLLEITQLGAAETLSLTVEISNVLTVGSLRVFSTDGGGGNRSQIASFSVVENEDNILPDFNPTFNLLNGDLIGITHLQFELEEKGVVSIATPTVLADGSLALTFDDGTQLIAALGETAPDTDLLLEDAETIDLSNLAGDITFSGTIHREAQFDNVIDLYVTDAEGAVFDAMGNRFLPGQEGYRDAAIASRLNINLTGTNGQVDTFNATLAGDQYLGIFVAVDGVDPTLANDTQLFFSHSGANGGIDHMKHLGTNTFGVEDQVGLGDSDFNDVIITFDIA